MNGRLDRSTKYEGETENGCHGVKRQSNKCPNKSSKDSVKIPVKPPESNFVMQIVSIGLRTDNVYEARMFLAPEVDMSSVKITVKNDNLRVTVHRPLGDLARQLPGILEKSALGDLVKRTVKHCENFLIPETINADEVRAVVDNKKRLLIVVVVLSMEKTEEWYLFYKIFGPVAEFGRCYAGFARVINVMEKLPHHCQDNGVFFRKQDYMDLDMMSDGLRTTFKFNKIPDFYTIDDQEYYAAEIKVAGLKVGTAALATEDILNVKMQEVEGGQRIRNFNFEIPPEANARKVSVEVFNGDTIFVRAPLKGKYV